MLQRLLCFVCLFIVVSGCTLTAANEAPVQSMTPTIQHIPIDTPTLSTQPLVTNETTDLSRVELSNPPPIETVSPPLEANCTLPVNWQSYTVAPGDTLSSIARRMNVTPAELAVANCLDDPDQISVGQPLSVPQQPNLPDTFTSVSSVSQCRTPFDYFFILNADRFEDGWCPSGPPQEQAMLIQQFENGYMLWRADTQTVYVLHHNPGENGGELSTFAGGDRLQGPDIPIDLATPPPGYYQPAGWFLTLWSTNQTVRGQVGRAILPAQSYTGAVQPVSITVGDNTASWSPRFFVNWSLNNNVLAVGSRAWEYVGIVALPPRGISLQSESLVGFPSIEPYVSFDGGNVEIEAKTSVTVTWHDAPVAQIAQVEFMFYPLDGSIPSGISVGIDSDMRDGVSVEWVVPQHVSGRLNAIGLMPGQFHEALLSNEIFVSSTTVATGGLNDSSIPNADSIIGQIEIAPLKRIEADTYVLQAGEVVNVYWQFVPADELLQVEFVFYSAGGDPNGELMNIDSNLQDGALIQWTVPQGLNGSIIASGKLPGQGGEFRMSEERQVVSE